LEEEKGPEARKGGRQGGSGSALRTEGEEAKQELALDPLVGRVEEDMGVDGWDEVLVGIVVVGGKKKRERSARKGRRFRVEGWPLVFDATGHDDGLENSRPINSKGNGRARLKNARADFCYNRRRARKEKNGHVKKLVQNRVRSSFPSRYFPPFARPAAPAAFFLASLDQRKKSH